MCFVSHPGHTHSIKGKVAGSLSKRGLRGTALCVSTEKATSVGTGALLHRAEQECKEEMSSHSSEAFPGF